MGVASDLFSSAAAIIENVEVQGEVVLKANCLVPIPHRHMRLDFYRQATSPKQPFVTYALEGQSFRFVRKLPNGRYRVEVKHERRDEVLTSKRVEISGNAVDLLLFIDCARPQNRPDSISSF